MADLLLTIVTVGVWALSGVVGNTTHRLACSAIRKVQAALLGRLREPRNHDLARAIRRSQLLALKLGLKAYRKLPHKNEELTLISGSAWPRGI
ncbi:MAG: hypothetical protein ACE10F_06015 [Candidatus Methylomirabilales bacterium]|jgi:sugar (pentulose or hexulose) kinase|nr:hypothetical protein [candidate division NC10 bacterium]